MVKRIETNQLRVGMFIESVEGAFLNTPFAGRRFLLENETDAEALRSSNLSGIYINPAKGLDSSGTGAAKNWEKAHRTVSIRQQASASARLEKARSSVANTVTETTDLLKGVFDTVRDGGGVSLATTAPIIAQIAKSMEQNGDIFINITRLKSRDETTFLHSISVSALMIRFARYLKLDAETVRLLGMSGLLHDIGKLTIPTDILNKESSLTETEMTLMRSHPSQGHAILSRQGDMPEIVLDVCLNHHERPDGKGYPAGISGDAISFHARIAAICDVYDAITSARPYKKPWTHADAAAWMLERKGFFDRPLLMQFLNGVLKS